MGSTDNPFCECSNHSRLERLRYFPRQLLTADDMRAEQEYFREKQRRHNRLLHGWGVVCGLKVVPNTDTEKGPLWVNVCPGYALDPLGDEIYVPEPFPLDLRYCAQPQPVKCTPAPAVVETTTTPPEIYVMIRHIDCPTRPMRSLPVGCGCDETSCEYSRTRDGFQIRGALTPPETYNAPHLPTICETENTKLLDCVPCPADLWIVLATITPKASAGGLTLEIDNAARRMLYSSAAIQEQVITSCSYT